MAPGILVGVMAAGIAIVVYLYHLKRKEASSAEDVKRSGVEADLEHLRGLIASKKNTQLIYAACGEYEHLNMVEGFGAVATLFKHRHRKRALDRLEIFCREWDENGLKLYGRI